MKRLLVVLLLLGTMASLAPAKSPWLVKDGYPVVTMDINMRPRFEVDGKDFNADTGLHDYGTLRTLLGINLMPDKDVLVRVRMKESRQLGMQQSNGAATSEFSAAEAFIRVDQLMGKPLSLQVGRFEYKHGRNRIFGPGGWSFRGPRAYDGIRLGFTPNYGEWELLWVKVADYDFLTPNASADRNMFVIAGELFDGHVQPLAVVDIDNNKGAMEEANMRTTAGLYYGRMMGDVKLDLDAYYQTGSQWDRDLAAWLLSAQVKYLFDGPKKLELGVGVDMTSGNKWDEDTVDDEDNMFYSPFMSRHAWRGYMDYFQDVSEGLTDIYLSAAIQPRKGVKLMVDLHNFSYLNEAALITAAPGGTNVTEYTAIGQEVDIKTVINLHKSVKLDAGYCMFMASDDFVPDGDAAHFGWVAFVVSF